MVRFLSITAISSSFFFLYIPLLFLFSDFSYFFYLYSIYSSKLLCIFNAELNLFLIVLSVLPGMCLAISDHFLPCSKYKSISLLSSSRVHFSFLMWGSRWLWYLSRHCLPALPGSYEAIKFQALAPWSLTSISNSWSSSSVHVPFWPP